MSKWIDAENAEFRLQCCGTYHGVIAFDTVKAVLKDAPSIDIVRCAECVYCNVQNTKYLYAICERHGIEFKPFEDDTRTHGCAWGERKESE